MEDQNTPIPREAREFQKQFPTSKKKLITIIILSILLLVAGIYIVNDSYIQPQLRNIVTNGKIQTIATIHQYKEFPFLVNTTEGIQVDSIPLCSQDFITYYKNICEGGQQ